eukprot:396727-Pyramimonas_sp.AAC.1
MIEATIDDKLVVVGSSLPLAKQVAAAAGLPQEVAKQNAVYVGTDISEGRRRGAGGASKQKQKRGTNMVRRLRKLRRFRKAIAGADKAQACGRIVKVGITPEACYGAEIA